MEVGIINLVHSKNILLMFFLEKYTLKEHLDKIKKPYISVRLDFTGGEYRIRTDHLLPARQAL
jgi:hypothetical protein